ncbi:FLYWCH-type domain-containing protein, partial [Aphis craccivora]
MPLYESEFSQVYRTMYTEFQHDNPVEKNPHNHLHDPEEIKVTKCIQKMKDQKQQLKLYRMPTEETVKRTLRRQRSKNCPINFTIIEGNWCTTGDPNFKRFLLYDTGSNSNERITIFATDDSLKLLSEAEEWFMDGNF